MNKNRKNTKSIPFNHMYLMGIKLSWKHPDYRSQCLPHKCQLLFMHRHLDGRDQMTKCTRMHYSEYKMVLNFPWPIVHSFLLGVL